MKFESYGLLVTLNPHYIILFRNFYWPFRTLLFALFVIFAHRGHKDIL